MRRLVHAAARIEVGERYGAECMREGIVRGNVGKERCEEITEEGNWWCKPRHQMHGGGGYTSVGAMQAGSRWAMSVPEGMEDYAVEE